MFVLNMDCVEGMRAFPDNHFDSIVTDPPYELGFMGKTWDASGIAYSVEMWREALRVLKPGGHLLAFSGSRTYHRMTCAIEDAGFEVRDQIMWVYGSGFPKSLDVSKAIDKAGPPGQAPFAEFASHYEVQRKAKRLTHAAVCAAGGWHGAVNHGGSSVNWANGYGMPTTDQWATLRDLLNLDKKWAERVARIQYEREVLGIKHGTRLAVAPGQENDRSVTGLEVTAAGSDAARQWQGWGTALKPAHEPICVARKPLIGTVAANVLAHGTGAINVDGCRVPTSDDLNGGAYSGGGKDLSAASSYATGVNAGEFVQPVGRWPANLIHDGSDEVLAAFPNAPGQMADASTNDTLRAGQNVYGAMRRGRGAEPSADSDNDGAVDFKMKPGARRMDAGSAARFFYCPKASKADRSEGNTHPTVKPTDLMRYLVRLVTPPGGTVLDPFTGSGSTGKAAVLEGFGFIGFELSAEYTAIATARMQHAIDSMGH